MMLALGVLGMGMIAVAVAGVDPDLAVLGYAGGALVLVIALHKVVLRLVPAVQPWSERTPERLTVVVYPRGRFAMFSLPLAVAMAAASYAAIAFGDGRNIAVAVVGLPLTIALLATSMLEGRYIVDENRIAHVVDYVLWVWVREVERPTVAWVETSKFNLELGTNASGTWSYRGTPGQRSPKTSVPFSLSPLPDDLAAEFVSEIVRRTSVELTYGVIPDELRG